MATVHAKPIKKPHHPRDSVREVVETIVFVVALVLSMAGLAYAMRELPVGTSYAVWVGIGAALTAGYAMWSGQEPVSALRVLLLLGMVACVVGLKLTH